MSDTKKLAEQYVKLAFAETHINAYYVGDELFNSPNEKVIDDPHGDATPVANPNYKISIVFDVGNSTNKSIDNADRAKNNLNVKGRILDREMANLGIIDVKDLDPQNTALQHYQIADEEYERAFSKRAFWNEVWFLVYGVQWSDFDYQGAIDAYNANKNSKAVLDENRFANAGKAKIKFVK